MELKSSNDSARNRYFDTTSLSRYPGEEEHLFFWANLQISGLQMYNSANQLVHFDMAPLLLAENISHGSTGTTAMTAESVQQKLAEYLSIESESANVHKQRRHNVVNSADKYGLEIFHNFMENHNDFYINGQLVTDQQAIKELKQYFRSSHHFKWIFDRVDYNELKEDGSVASQEMACDDGTVFYLQCNRIEQKGVIIVVLYGMNGTDTKLQNVAFGLSCKRLKDMDFDDLDAKLENIDFDCSESGVEAGKHYQGVDFDIDSLFKEFEEKKRKQIVWEFTVTF